MGKSVLHENVLEILGIDGLSENDQIAFLSHSGDEIFETAIERFEGLLSQPELHRVQLYLASSPEPEEVINHLVNEFATFAEVLRGVVSERAE